MKLEISFSILAFVLIIFIILAIAQIIVDVAKINANAIKENCNIEYIKGFEDAVDCIEKTKEDMLIKIGRISGENTTHEDGKYYDIIIECGINKKIKYIVYDNSVKEVCVDNNCVEYEVKD